MGVARWFRALFVQFTASAGSPGMSSELVATYSGLGFQDGEEYFKGEECLGKESLDNQ